MTTTRRRRLAQIERASARAGTALMAVAVGLGIVALFDRNRHVSRLAAWALGAAVCLFGVSFVSFSAAGR